MGLLGGGGTDSGFFCLCGSSVSTPAMQPPQCPPEETADPPSNRAWPPPGATPLLGKPGIRHVASRHARDLTATGK